MKKGAPFSERRLTLFTTILAIQGCKTIHFIKLRDDNLLFGQSQPPLEKLLVHTNIFIIIMGIPRTRMTNRTFVSVGKANSSQGKNSSW